MNNLANTIQLIESGDFSLESLVSILILIESKIDIDTVSGMARKEDKTPRGIRTSKQYRKIKIGGQLMVVKGLSESYLPF